MINKENYFSTIENIGESTLPPTLAKSHDFVLKVTRNGESWTSYSASETVRNAIDLYFQKLDDFIKQNRSRRTFVIPGKKAVKQESSSTTKDNSKKTTDPAVKDDVTEPKSVARISEEVKFIKRFVGLHNKKKSPQTILSFIKSLQRSIVQKLIRKTSPFAKEIQSIQQALIDFYHSMKGEKPMKIGDNDLTKLVAIAGGEKVYPSLNIMKRYIGLQGKPIDKDLIDRFVSQIEKALDKKIMADDPYADKVKDIYNTLRKSKSSKTFSIKSSELNGLAGIVKQCTCKHKHLGQIYRIKKSDAAKAVKSKRVRECNFKTYSDARGKGTCSHNGGLSGVPTIPNSRVLTAEQMGNRRHDVLDFTSFWYALFGKPEKSFVMMLHGEPHNGKTILLLMFAKYLAENFGTVLYVTSEEFDSSAMTEKINELVSPKPVRLHFIDSLETIDLSPYDYVILDSVNDLGLKPNDFKAIVKQYSQEGHAAKGYILNLQHTKTGQFKGGKDWEHIPGIVGEVSKGIVSLTKNRYGQKNTLNFFEQFGLKWSEPKPIVYVSSGTLPPDHNQQNNASDNETIY